MAGKGGSRSNAGRKAGGKNAATREREALAERILAEQRGQPGKKLAREVLDDFMQLFTGLAAMYQPLPQGVVPMSGQKPDEEKFMLYAQAAVSTAKELASYQSPKFKAILMAGGLENNPGGALPSPAQVADQVEQITAQQAYRMLRDSDVIDVVPNTAPAPVRKASARG